ncbi:hypothetical protein [Microbispora sp. NPDC049633]|uniref:hypothetical protein n=1 Tax=Microbispora sp. NPDC049633 TaxID=3154355 RepID=UPI003436C64B
MPLPSGGTWPPKPLTPIHDQYNVWSTWYEGDPDALAALYGDTRGDHARPANRPSTYRGGIVGGVARFFWGAPTPAGEKRTKLHIPLPADLATTAADLLYSEPPSITVTDTGTQDRINELIDAGLHATLLDGSEVGGALGGSYLRICWDKAIADRPWIDAVHADAAVPDWTWGKLRAVTFWRVLEEDGQERLVHLERHEPGHILNGLYKGTRGDLGKQIQLTSHEATKGLQPVVPTGIKKLTAGYLPCRRPTRRWRRFPAGANLGRSLFEGVEHLFDSLDEVYTSWMRDIRLAKARLIVPSSYLQSNGPGQGASFEADREVYEALEALTSGERMEITPQQFAIRVAEHEQSAMAIVQVILRTVGFSAQTFGMQGETAMTATEVAAKERRSLITRDRMITYQRPELEDIVETWLMLDNKLGSGVEVERPNVVFGDGVSEDTRTLAETANLLAQAQSASIETRVHLLHPDWDETQVADEVERIKEENNIGAVVPDPFALRPPGAFGDQGEGVEPPADDEQDGPPES